MVMFWDARTRSRPSRERERLRLRKLEMWACEPAAVASGVSNGDRAAGGCWNGSACGRWFRSAAAGWGFWAGCGSGPGAAESGAEFFDSTRGAGGALLRADV